MSSHSFPQKDKAFYNFVNFPRGTFAETNTAHVRVCNFYIQITNCFPCAIYMLLIPNPPVL